MEIIKASVMVVIRILLIVSIVLLAGCRADVSGERILFDFESDEELDQLNWSCHTLYSLSSEHATHGSQSIKMELFPSDYPGLTPKLTVKDWHKYRGLYFDVYNPSTKPVPIGVRIDDRKDYPEYEDRYNKSFILKPGMNHISISFETMVTSGPRRVLNTSSMERLIIFMSHPETRTILYIDAIKLSKDKIGSNGENIQKSAGNL